MAQKGLWEFCNVFKATVLYNSYFRSKMINKKQSTFNLQSNVWSITTSQHSILKDHNLYFTPGKKNVYRKSDLPGSNPELRMELTHHKLVC